MGEYLDFELRLEKRGQRYQATVVRSPAGEASYSFKLPFSRLELENFILRMEGIRSGMRRIRSPEMEMVRQFGDKLFEAVFNDDVRTCYVSGQNEAKSRGVGLRMKLRLEAPELINIPWEFLYDDSAGRFLALFEDTPIVRYVDVRERNQPLKLKPPLNVLVMISGPEDYPHLNAEREKANLQAALGNLIEEGTIRITWIEKATLPNLADYLMRGSYNVFHFIGHGGFDEHSQDGILVLEDERGEGQWASGERLAVLLGNQSKMRLVILNACEGGRTSSKDPFAGVATTLLRTGAVPAVVAMQLAITDTAAITFARGFYSAVSVGRPVDAAVTQARLSIFATGNDVEWGTPVLYMRSPDGVIFDVQALTAEERAEMQRVAEKARADEETRARLEEEQREKAAAREKALAEERARQEEIARQKAVEEQRAREKALAEESARQEEITRQKAAEEQRTRDEAAAREKALAEESTRQEETARLKAEEELRVQREAQAQQEALEERRALQEQDERRKAEEEKSARLAGLYEGASAALAARDWSGALQLLSQVCDLDPAYQDTAELLLQAQAGEERDRQTAVLLDEGKQRLQKGEAALAAESFQKVLALAPDHAEGAALLRQAEETVQQAQLAAEREARLTDLYNQAAARVDARDWDGASVLLAEIDSLKPGYEDKAGLRKWVQDGREQDQLTAQLAGAFEALRQGRLVEAKRTFQGVLDRAPGNAEAQQGLVAVGKKEQVNGLYAKAQKDLQAGQLAAAADGFQAVLNLDAAHQDAAHQLAEVNTRLQVLKKEEEARKRAESARQAELARLYDAADAAARAGDWAEAVRLFQDLQARDAAYRDAKGRLAQVKKTLADADAASQRKAKLAAAFSLAMTHFQAKRWDQAIPGLQAVLELDPNYVDAVHGRASALLERAKQEKERNEMPQPPGAKPPAPKPSSSRPGTLPEDKPARGKPTDLPK